MINLNEMEVGKSYILTLRDGEEKGMVCCNKYNDYVNFGYFNWNFYFNGKYKDQDLPSMDIISYCNAPLTEVEKLRQQLQAKEEEIENENLQSSPKETITVEKKVFDTLQKNNLDLMAKLEIAKAGLRFLSEKSKFAKNLLKELENDK